MKKKFILLVAALLMGGYPLLAQDFGVDYDCEFQTNRFDSKVVSLLRFNAEIPLFGSFAMEMAAISISRIGDVAMAPDLQTFSNIEEEPLPLALAVGGLHWNRNHHHWLFIGIRNMNEDYFTSEVTSFFCNSSCGIYPTLSANYPIANYPLASPCLHYRYQKDPLTIQASIYNGRGHNRFLGPESIFRLRPMKDGVWSLGEARFEKGGSVVSMGFGMHWSTAIGVSPWAYWEQRISSSLSAISGFSHAWGSQTECSNFAGIGIRYRKGISSIGIFTDRAQFASANEWATEFNWNITFDKLQLYFIDHLIRTDYQWNNISCIRLSLSI